MFNLMSNTGVKPYPLSIPGILAPNEFQSVLDREISRADRTLNPFTLLSFELQYPDATQVEYGKLAFRLAHVIRTNIRNSDVAGWYLHKSKYRISVILNDTPPNQSKRVIQKIQEQFEQNVLRKSSIPAIQLLCSVSYYPKNNSNEWTSKDWYDGLSDDEHFQIELQDEIHEYQMPIWKRTIDIIGALTALTLLSPLFLIVGLFIKLVSKGPMFFKQTRIGLNGKQFLMFKFRTMETNVDTSVHQLYVTQLIKESVDNSHQSVRPMKKIDTSMHVIPLGHILRKTSLDELPQFINVLLGEMSLVGPRPAIPYEYEEYSHWHTKRVNITPGITGLWQVMGKNEIPFKDMIRLDIAYARDMSFLLDISIMYRTPSIILNQLKSYIYHKDNFKTEVINNV